MSRLLLIASFPDSIVSFRGRLLDRLVDAGVDVHVVAPNLRKNVKIAGKLQQMGVIAHDVSMQRTGLNPLHDAWSFFRLLVLICTLRPDAVFSYTAKPVIYGTVAAWLARVPKRFVLITGLGYAFTSGRSGFSTTIVSWLYKVALRRASKVFFQNADDQEYFLSIGVMPKAVVSVVTNGSGVDLEEFPQVPIIAKPITFLMICRLLGDKGVREYAFAAMAVKRRHPEVRCLLVGWIDDNPDAIAEEELQGWINDGRIEFLGRLSDVREAIASSDVYVLPSYREGTPRTVLEAMAMGRPVITTNAPGCKQTVEHCKNGFLVPVGSTKEVVAAMEFFVNNQDVLRTMGMASRKRAEELFDVHKVNSVLLAEMDLPGMGSAETV